jgi:hypothetical protein
MLFQTAVMASLAASLLAPAPIQHSTYHGQKARRHFVSLSYDWQYTHPLGFNHHPLEDLLGQPVSEVHLELFDYRTEDGLTTVDVQEFSHKGEGIGLTVYPFGSSEGTTLAIRGSIEGLPTVRMTFAGPSPISSYTLTNARAYDVAVGIDMSDRSPGWGLGSHAFILGGLGRVRGDERDGTRYFAEGGGGVMTGPIGVDVSVKVATNRFSTPIPHSFLTLPVSVRGTFSF